MKIEDADTAENGTASKNIIISPVSCALPNRAPNSPKLSGHEEIHFVPGTLIAEIMGTAVSHEEHFCNYEMNAGYKERFEDSGLVFNAFGMNDAPRGFEIPQKRFFLATLFQPQLSSSAAQPHPIVMEFCTVAQKAELRASQKK